jgi:hypothetical protein
MFKCDYVDWLGFQMPQTPHNQHYQLKCVQHKGNLFLGGGGGRQLRNQWLCCTEQKLEDEQSSRGADKH